jgi:microcystin-dependent protein
MSDPFVGEIRMFAGNFAPRGWAMCDGQLMSISQNAALFTLLRTQFGGDGRTVFALPDLQGRVPIGLGEGPGLSERVIGEQVGVASVSLNQAEMPAHQHTPMGSSSEDAAATPSEATWGMNATEPRYRTGAGTVPMQAEALSVTGGGLPHQNMQPYVAVTFMIALQGIFPMRQ